MKRKAFIVAIFIGFGFAQTNAQSFIKKITKNLSCGIKAEGNLSNFIMSGMPDVKINAKIGTSVGVFLRFEISKHFAIQEDVFCVYRTSILKQGDIKGRYEYGGLEAPIYAIGQWTRKEEERFFIGIGPYAEWGLHTIFKIGESEIDLYKKDRTTNKSYLGKFAFGFAAIIGYEFSDRTQLNAGYKIGATNVLNAGKGSASMLPSTFSLGAGYRF